MTYVLEHVTENCIIY